MTEVLRLIQRQIPNSNPRPQPRAAGPPARAVRGPDTASLEGRDPALDQRHHRPAGMRFDEHDVGACARAEMAQFLSRSEEHTSELQSHSDLVCRLLLEKKKEKKTLLQ